MSDKLMRYMLPIAGQAVDWYISMRGDGKLLIDWEYSRPSGRKFEYSDNKHFPWHIITTRSTL